MKTACFLCHSKICIMSRGSIGGKKSKPLHATYQRGKVKFETTMSKNEIRKFKILATAFSFDSVDACDPAAVSFPLTVIDYRGDSFWVQNYRFGFYLLILHAQNCFFKRLRIAGARVNYFFGIVKPFHLNFVSIWNLKKIQFRKLFECVSTPLWNLKRVFISNFIDICRFTIDAFIWP